MATIGDPESLDPAWTYETFGAGVEQQVYDTMIFYDRYSVDIFVPNLATEWEVSDDALTYTFHIREGVTFHEGGTLEPHDIAYTIQRMLLQDRVDGPVWIFLEPLVGTSTINDLAAEAGDVAACEKAKEAVVADDEAGTVTLNLVAPFGPMFQVLAQPWAGAMDMEWMIEQGDWDGRCDTWRNWNDPAAEESIVFKQMNGTGPFMLDHWTPGEEIVLVRNPNYWRTEPLWEGGPSGPAALERVVIKEVDEFGTRLAMLQAADADHIYVPRQFISQLEDLLVEECTGVDPVTGLSKDCVATGKAGAVRVTKDIVQPASDTFFFTFNINTEGGNPFIGSGTLDGSGIPPDFFSDIHIRKAFNYCFDWETYIADVYLGEAAQERGPIIPGMAGYDPNSFVYSYDPAKCEEEFKASTLTAEDGASLWDTGFYMQLAYNTGNATRQAASELLKQGLEAINPNFSVAVVNIPWPAYLDARRGARLPVHLTGWLEDYHHPHNWVVPYMASYGAFSRAQFFPEDLQTLFDEKIAAAVQLTDPAAADAAYKELQQLAVDNVIDIFLVTPLGRRYEQAWVKGWVYNPLFPMLQFFYTISEE